MSGPAAVLDTPHSKDYDKNFNGVDVERAPGDAVNLESGRKKAG